MPRMPSWRVRVKRSMEDWVEVDAPTAISAEDEALKVPGVLQVFSKSAIRSDTRDMPTGPAGVPET